MSITLHPQLQPYKQLIPEFVMKLYHILQNKRHSEYLAWHGDEIVVKNPKKFQQKVLSQYFRHKHLSSFIRQLNIYKFNKVPKIIKQKNHLYFKNENFQRGKIQNLLLIKRNVKRKRNNDATITPVKQDDSVEEIDNISLDGKLAWKERGNGQLEMYKQLVKRMIGQVKEIIVTKTELQLGLEFELKPVIEICDELLETNKNELPQFGLSSFSESQYQLNLLNTQHAGLRGIESSLIFPSGWSLSNLNSFQSRR